MTISPISTGASLNGATASLLGGATTASQATATSSGVPAFLSTADQRIQTDLSVTTAQISNFGAIQSALSDNQAAAQAMTTLSSTVTSADATTALGNFFNTFNAAISAATTASAASGTGTAADRATGIVQDLKSALSSDPSIEDAMQKLGLTIQSDGSLAQNPQQFANSLAADPSGTLAAMALIGGKVDAVTGNELASGGAVSTALATLNAKSTTLTAEQSAVQSLEQTMATVDASDPFTSTDSSSSLITAEDPYTSTAATSASSLTSSVYSAGVAAYQSNMPIA